MKDIKWVAEKKADEDDDEYLETEGIYRVLAFFIHDQNKDSKWVEENCKSVSSPEWLDAVLDQKYLIGEIQRDLGISPE